MTIKNLKPNFQKLNMYLLAMERRKNLIKLSKELNLENEVIFLKNIDYDLKIALIAESNLFLMPSRIEKNQ